MNYVLMDLRNRFHRQDHLRNNVVLINFLSMARIPRQIRNAELPFESWYTIHPFQHNVSYFDVFLSKAESVAGINNGQMSPGFHMNFITLTMEN